MSIWPGPFRNFNEVRVFVISLSLIILLFISAIFLGIYLRTNTLLMGTIKDEAVSYFNLIVQTRLWNAQYGGVYVEKRGDVQHNPYLKGIGIEPDIKCDGNKILTMRNPAQMTKEISRITDTKSGVRFHITSLKPINPENAPDIFEQNALQKFEGGDREVWKVDRISTPHVFRYMAPLKVEQSCLPCHERQGYRTGDIRGGISVTIPLGELDHKMNTNNLMIIVFSILTIALLLVILYFLVWKLVVRLDESQEKLKQISITDELTGLRNRRYIMGRFGEEFKRVKRLNRPMGLIMFDLDFFKKINDTYGHQFGDLVLKTVASQLKSGIREYDLLGRIGGEEFLILAPDSDLEETLGIAERIREIIKSEKISDGYREVNVTISAGVTMMKEQDRDIDVIFSRVDTALYKAKQEGRDRVVVL